MMPNEIPNFITRAMNVYDNDDVLALCQESQIIIGDQINLTMMKIDHNCLHIAEDIDNGLGIENIYKIWNELKKKIILILLSSFIHSFFHSLIFFQRFVLKQTNK